jgi:hypothetical protein
MKRSLALLFASAVIAFGQVADQYPLGPDSKPQLGIQVCDQAGRVNAILPTPNGRVANVTFGGENFDVLFAMCGDKVYQRKLKVQGANAWAAPLRPAPPRL